MADRHGCRPRGSTATWGRDTSRRRGNVLEPALRTLDERFTSGEIGAEEYASRRAELEAERAPRASWWGPGKRVAVAVAVALVALVTLAIALTAGAGPARAAGGTARAASATCAAGAGGAMTAGASG